jgi:riboflavin kinase
MKAFQDEELLNIPDLLFSKFCEEKYEINKGVYNTIDHWFYQQGLSRIVERRKTILNFFQYICLIENKNTKVKFGPGGLTTKLKQFWQQGVRIAQ